MYVMDVITMVFESTLFRFFQEFRNVADGKVDNDGYCQSCKVRVALVFLIAISFLLYGIVVKLSQRQPTGRNTYCR